LKNNALFFGGLKNCFIQIEAKIIKQKKNYGRFVSWLYIKCFCLLKNCFSLFILKQMSFPRV
jgi:hypothetical protein